MSFIVPGENIAVIEEAIPTSGVYVDEKGYIRALFAGTALLDKYRKTAGVKPLSKREFSLKPGSIAEGVVTSVSEDVAVVRIYSANGSRILGAIGLLHVSQLTSEFVVDIYEYIKPSDLVKAKVLNAHPPYILSTREPSLGVLLAHCGNCGRELYLMPSGILRCNNCGNHERRKVAVGYMLVSR
ncbi:MAG: exosome complex RNA-binding protein Csl4 [Desulfurococcaceae archaeon]